MAKELIVGNPINQTFATSAKPHLMRTFSRSSLSLATAVRTASSCSGL